MKIDEWINEYGIRGSVNHPSEITSYDIPDYKIDRLRNIEKENEKLREEKSKLTKNYSLLSNSHTNLMKCVEFYADEKNYIEICIEGSTSNPSVCDGDYVDCLVCPVDRGYERAKRTLKELNTNKESE